MTTTTQTIKATYPLPSYQYRVVIAGPGTTTTTLNFSQVTGLTILYKTTSYKQSLGDSDQKPQSMTMPAQKDSSNPISFNRGIVNSTQITYLYDWINSIKTNVVDKRDITITLCDETGAGVVSWKLNNAFPVRLDAPSFVANSNDAAIESLQVLAQSIEMDTQKPAPKT